MPTAPFRLAVHRTPWLVALLCTVIVPLALALHPNAVGGAPANTITVNTTSDTDTSKCRLRDAIVAANTNAAVNGCGAGSLGADTINFSLLEFCPPIGCTVVLGSGLPPVTQDLTINGAGKGVDGANLYLIFDLRAAVVTINGLRIQNGKGDFGAGVKMDNTTLILNNATVSGNHAHSAAGIYQSNGGALYVNNSSFQGNVAELNGFGGAIGQGSGIAFIANSTFSSNFAGLGGAVASLGSSNVDVSASVFDSNGAGILGGAFYLQDQSVRARIAGSLLTNNQALTTTASYGGGAIYNTRGSLVLTGTTLANNLAGGRGGALNVFGGPITITNVTISGNGAKESGGGIYVLAENPFLVPTALTFNNVTLTNNTADTDINGIGDGGGIRAASGILTFTNSIIAGNFDTPGNAGPGTKHPDCSGVYTTTRYTLIGRNDGCTGFVDGNGGNRVGTAGSPLDPLLAPLAANGGPWAGTGVGQPVPTHAVLAGSPAFNGGNPAAPGSGVFACNVLDQRGMPRPLGAACDMGAYEAGTQVWLPLVRR